MRYDCPKKEFSKRHNQSVNSKIEEMEHNAKVKSKERDGKKWSTEEIASLIEMYEEKSWPWNVYNKSYHMRDKGEGVVHAGQCSIKRGCLKKGVSMSANFQ